MQFVTGVAAKLFDPLHDWWESGRTQRGVAAVLAIIFLAGLLGIEAKRQGLLPAGLAVHVPESHFHAVNLAFSLVLALEVIGLVFALPHSVSRSVGKQFEILSLILLRNAFKQLSLFDEPVRVSGNLEPLWHILADGAGALMVFAALGVYYRMQHKRSLLPGGGEDKARFIAAKKVVALALLTVFTLLGGVSVFEYLAMPSHADAIHLFFETFYTILIFSDILIVLVSQRYLPGYHAVFRNSCYALATLLIRLALSAPPPLDAALGVVAALFTVVLAKTYLTFSPCLFDENEEVCETGVR